MSRGLSCRAEPPAVSTTTSSAQAGVSRPRIRVVSQTRPWSSSIGLCELVLPWMRPIRDGSRPGLSRIGTACDVTVWVTGSSAQR